MQLSHLDMGYGGSGTDGPAFLVGDVGPCQGDNQLLRGATAHEHGQTELRWLNRTSVDNNDFTHGQTMAAVAIFRQLRPRDRLLRAFLPEKFPDH